MIFILLLKVIPLEDCIHSELIPKFLGPDIPGKLERDLFSLPVRLGGLGLFIPILLLLLINIIVLFMQALPWLI